MHRAVTYWQSLQTYRQSFGALQARKRDEGMPRETNKGSRGRSEEMQQLCDSGKENE